MVVRRPSSALRGKASCRVSMCSTTSTQAGPGDRSLPLHSSPAGGWTRGPQSSWTIRASSRLQSQSHSQADVLQVGRIFVQVGAVQHLHVRHERAAAQYAVDAGVLTGGRVERGGLAYLRPQLPTPGSRVACHVVQAVAVGRVGVHRVGSTQQCPRRRCASRRSTHPQSRGGSSRRQQGCGRYGRRTTSRA